MTRTRETKSLDHLAEDVSSGKFAGQVVLAVQQAGHGVTVAVAGGERVGGVECHRLSPPGLRSGENN